MKRLHARFGLVLGLVGSSMFVTGSADAQTQQTSQAPAYRTASAKGYFVQDSAAPAATYTSDCGCGSVAPAASACGCDSGCSTGGCNLGSRLGNLGGGSCGLGALCNFGSQCELDDPWTLFGNNECGPLAGLNIGGWFQMGYHENSNGLFNSRPDQFALHQGWLFVEKVAEAGDCGEMGFGFRFDGMYGIDAAETQAFGNTGANGAGARGWDNGPGFNRGAYGWALPQAYVEMAKNDWSVKVGHFYTLVGYEVVTAPDNFFYSHAFTMFNSEPFTHTGAVGTYNASDDLTIYGGWTAGWDTGFDQFGDGSNFLGGFSSQLTEDVAFTYITTFGDFGARGSDAYSHSMVFDTALTENLNWVVQSDLVDINSTGEENIGINQYLFYTCSDRLSYGLRAEWWKADENLAFNPFNGTAVTESTSYYNATVGMNYRINPNLIVRPEYRYDWSPGLNYDVGTFGFDMIATF